MVSSSTAKNKIICVGHSPDPDDAFMFYGLSSGKVKLDGITVQHVLEDIQSLNERAMQVEAYHDTPLLDVTAISAHTYPYIADKYWIMATGASMGEGYGPVLISKRYRTLDELKGKTVATPGKLTTATLLLKLFTDGLNNVDVPFDQIMNRVANNEFDAGLLIHEGQITYGELGFNKILDFGEFWAQRYNSLPLPLGLDVVRKDLGEELARTLSHALKESIHYAYTHQQESFPYALRYGRGIKKELGEKFVKMYVSELTVDMGERGKRALELLFKLGADHGLIPRVDSVLLF